MLNYPSDELLHHKYLEIINRLYILQEILQEVGRFFREELLRNLGQQRIFRQLAEGLGRFCVSVRTDTLEF